LEAKRLFFRDEDQSPDEDRPAEKILDLPARSRFGEGRAEPLRHWNLTFEVCKTSAFMHNENDPYPSDAPQF
jgi:hypothetical protein